MLPFAKYYTLSRNKRDSLTATRPCIHSVHDHITFTHHNTASAAMKLILALQMNWCTRRRSSRRSLTSLTRRLQKCPATKLPREDHFSRLPLRLQPPSTFTSLHVFREDTCSHLPGKARKSASFAQPSPLDDVYVFYCLPTYLPNFCLTFPVLDDKMQMLRFSVWDFPLYVKNSSPNSIPSNPLPSLTTANLWRLFLFSRFFQRIGLRSPMPFRQILRIEHRCRDYLDDVYRRERMCTTLG